MYSKPLIKKGLVRRILRHRVTAEQFREARIFSGFDRYEAADFLGVSLRTVGHWETGKARPSYAAFRLLRVYRHGEIIDPTWSGYRFVRGGLITPEGHRIEPADMAWHSLLVRQAREFQRQARAKREASRIATACPVRSAPAETGSIRATDAGTPARSAALPSRTVAGTNSQSIGNPDRIRGLPSSNRGVSRFRNDLFDRRALSVVRSLAVRA